MSRARQALPIASAVKTSCLLTLEESVSPQLTGLGRVVGLAGYTVSLWGTFLQCTCPSQLCISPPSAEEVILTNCSHLQPDGNCILGVEFLLFEVSLIW